MIKKKYTDKKYIIPSASEVRKMSEDLLNDKEYVWNLIHDRLAEIITNAVKTIMSPIPTTGLTIGDLTIEPEESDKYTLSAYYWKFKGRTDGLCYSLLFRSC